MKGLYVLPAQKQYNVLVYNILNEEKRSAIKYISFGYT